MLSLISQSIPSQKPQCLGLTKACFLHGKGEACLSVEGHLGTTRRRRLVVSSQISQRGASRHSLQMTCGLPPPPPPLALCGGISVRLCLCALNTQSLRDQSLRCYSERDSHPFPIWGFRNQSTPTPRGQLLAKVLVMDAVSSLWWFTGDIKGKKEGRKAMRLCACHCTGKLEGNVLPAPPRHPSCPVSGLRRAQALATAHVPWLCHLLSGGTLS